MQKSDMRHKQGIVALLRRVEHMKQPQQAAPRHTRCTDPPMSIADEQGRSILQLALT